MNGNEIEQLQPQAVWQWFARLCETPRPSFHEKAIREVLVKAAQNRGLAVDVDAKGNLRIRKPATPGMENRMPVAIQAHMDMVAQKESDSTHDFRRDPIRTKVIDGWVWADGTTLGADNGMGLSLGLAVLFSEDIPHPPLTLIVTVEEETGMGGAEAISPEWLDMPYLINLDTEKAGELFIGCAGGFDASLSLPLGWVPNSNEACTIRVSGLRGGHSGIDIDKNHANANLLLARILSSLYAHKPFALVTWQGGQLRNVITREAEATIVAEKAQIERDIVAITAVLRAEWAGEEHLCIEVLPAKTPDYAASLADTEKALDLMLLVPNGVLRMSEQFAGIVETSSNIGIVETEADELHIHSMMRSLLETPKVEFEQKWRAIARLSQAQLEISGDYPGWAPNVDSGLLHLAQEIFARHYGCEAPLRIIHAGLECGVLGGKAPQLEMISFGPDIRSAHSPKERVNIASVAECWSILLELLKAIPKQV
ncbi:aminoacyl-histidine dipeptidase [Neisseriaceae bacterium ESL0693]|nr:aminoacyl-histidine dipeptidase [Neisseriaceae bacterium ESL0693]